MLHVEKCFVGAYGACAVGRVVRRHLLAVRPVPRTLDRADQKSLSGRSFSVLRFDEEENEFQS